MEKRNKRGQSHDPIVVQKYDHVMQIAECTLGVLVKSTLYTHMNRHKTTSGLLVARQNEIQIWNVDKMLRQIRRVCCVWISAVRHAPIYKFFCFASDQTTTSKSNKWWLIVMWRCSGKMLGRTQIIDAHANAFEREARFDGQWLITYLILMHHTSYSFCVPFFLLSVVVRIHSKLI